MASTRYHHQAIEIYQDPQAYDSAPMPTTSKRSAAAIPTQSLRALEDAPSRKNIVFQPPRSAESPCKPSPLKSSHQYASSPLSSSPSRRPLGTTSSKFNMVSMPPPPPHASFQLTDSIEKRMAMGPPKALFTTFMSNMPEDKENMDNPAQHNTLSAKADFPIDVRYGAKSTGKRTLRDAAPIQESSRPCKKSKATSDALRIPSHDEFPALHDDGSKPGHSYAQLIGMAILRNPARRLTLAQIYKWISDTYSFYNPSDAGWQNSIRHNLSLNKAFMKQERPKDDPGKGNYWAIAPGTEQQFIKGKQSGKGAAGESNLSSIKVATKAPELPPPYYAPEPPIRNPDPDMSSDATIPASDAFIPEPEEEREEESLMPPPPPNHHLLLLASSPPPTMHSSPPVSRHAHRDDTPPPVPQWPTSSVLRHRGTGASMDDSGYFSALSSSIQRPSTSRDAQKTRFASRGRAEEEIARLRGSSYDSPTKSASRPSRALDFSSQSRHDSSPVRRSYDSAPMLPPLTPAVQLEAPASRPPASVSPNANLRAHRQRVQELLGSPLRDLPTWDDAETLPWSPAFNIIESPAFKVEGTPYSFHGGGLGFDIYPEAEASTDDCNVHAIQSNAMNGSPEKKKKPRLVQANGRHRSRGALGDVTNTRQQHLGNAFSGGRAESTNKPQLSPYPNVHGTETSESPVTSRGIANQLSPSRAMAAPSASDQVYSHALMGFDSTATGYDHMAAGWGDGNFLVEDFDAGEQEDVDAEAGVDLYRGFEKIGSGRNGAASAVSSFGAGLAGGATLGNGGRPGMSTSFPGRC